MRYTVKLILLCLLLFTTLSGQTWLIIWTLLSLQHPLEPLCVWECKDPDLRRISMASENPLFMLWLWGLKKWESSRREFLCWSTFASPLRGGVSLSVLCFASSTITSRSSYSPSSSSSSSSSPSCSSSSSSSSRPAFSFSFTVVWLFW